MASDKKPFPVLPVTIASGAIFVLFAVAFVAIAVSGSGDDDPEVATTPTVIESNEVTIRIADYEFVPPNVSVPLDATITWVNEDTAPHDATIESEDSIGTTILRKGESDDLTFDEPGEYDYYCSIHPSRMKAKLTVRAN